MKQNIDGYSYFFTEFQSKFHEQYVPYFNKNKKGVSSKLNIKKKLIKISFFSVIFAISSLNETNAMLSATTFRMIQGNEPQFFANETIINKLGFHYNGNDYNELNGNIKSDTIKYFDENTKLSDFNIKSYFTPRASINDLSGDYFDVDGDAFDPVTPVTNTLKFVWKDNRGKLIDEVDYDDIVCSHNKYEMPLQLEITAKDIKIKTEYGYPQESYPVSHIITDSLETKPITKTYKIAIAKACFAKPNGINSSPDYQWRSVKNDNSGVDDKWNLTGAGINGINKDKPNPELGGGYTDDYVVNQGFKVKPTASNGKLFPTTGFKGAQFQLVMGGRQEDYIFTSSNTFTPVDENGLVTLEGPVKNATISATLKSDNNIHYNYSFTLDLWVEPTDDLVTNQQEAKLKCVSPMSLLSRQDLNNGSSFSSKNLDSYQGRIYNVFTRGIGLGVFGEWGRAIKYDIYGISPSYPKSNWSYGWFFTKETHPTTNINNPTEGIVVSNHDGMISFPSAWGRDESKRVVCGRHL